MANASKKEINRSQQQILYNKTARAIFSAADSLGISDRRLIEKLTEEVIRNLQQGQSSARIPLPGMEDLVSHTKSKDSTQSVLNLEDAIKKSLAEIMAKSEGLKDSTASDERNSQKVTILTSEERVQAVPGKIQISTNALRVLEKRYLEKDSGGKVIETPEQLFRRVTKTIASAEKLFSPDADTVYWEDVFYNIMTNFIFLPNSPTLMNAGRELGQLSACFVLPIEDSMESIFEAVKYTALIHKSGGGTGFSFSRLRPENDRVGSTGGVASGPVSFIRAFDTATDVIKQGGMRRGANMAILSVNHPDIMKFITAKEDNISFPNFNFSVAVTEQFMKAVENDEEYDLINPRTGKSTSRVRAKTVFDRIAEMAWKTGDPGIVFIDRVNQNNPLPQIGVIEATNPCGEQPLLPYESCNLGSVNLSKVLKLKNGKYDIDFEKLREFIHISVRFLDNVIEVNKFPFQQIEQMTMASRKVGLGVMGFADMLLIMGVPYDSPAALEVAEKVMKFISEEATKASMKLAEERGVFPLFENSAYSGSGIKIRNAARTTIAPTGTLSIIANCSSGIEPLFALSYTRTILEGEQLIEVNPYFEKAAREGGFYSEELMKALTVAGSIKHMEGIPDDIKRVFVTSHDIAPEWHVKMQAVFQKYTDNAVSKTVNFPESATVDDVRRVYLLAYHEGCKGITIYRDRSKQTQVLSTAKAKKEEGTLTIPRDRPKVTTGYTERVSTGCGYIYVTVNFDDKGIFEVFSSLGKAGGCASAQLESMGRLISLALRSGIEVASIVKHLRGIRCPSISWEDGHAVLSCADAIASVLEKQISGGKSADTVVKSHGQEVTREQTTVEHFAGQCPDCGGLLIYQEGCYLCRGCGYTKCS